MTDQTKIIELIRAQSGMSRDIIRAQQDVNEIAKIQREDSKHLELKIDNVESKVDKIDIEIDKKIWKAILYVIGLLGSVIAWGISNRDKLGF